MEKIEQTKKTILLLAILFVFILVCLISSSRTSLTYDEIVYIPLSYLFLSKGEIHISTPLVLVFLGLPQYLANPKIDDRTIGAYRIGDLSDLINQVYFGHVYLGLMGNDRQSLIALSRLGNIIAGVLLILVAYFWSVLLFEGGGLLSAALAATCPAIIGLASVATSDMLVTLGIAATCFFYYLYLSEQRFLWLFLCGASFGSAQLCKQSAFLLLPVLLLMSAGELLFARKEALQAIKRMLFALVVIAFMGWLILNTGYLWRGSFDTSWSHRFNSNFMRGLYVKLWPGWLPTLLPGDYLEAIDFNMGISEDGWPAYYLGKVSKDYIYGYYALSLLVKTPITALVAALLALIIACRNHEKWRDYYHLLIPAIFYFMYFSFIGKRYQGVRYILICYPVLCILLGLLSRVKLSTPLRSMAALILIVGYLVEVFSAHPNYLSYYNALAGGQKGGYKLMVDSNTDWGQGLVQLKEYMDKHKIDSVYLSYFGMADPEWYGIEYEQLHTLSNQPWTWLNGKDDLGCEPRVPGVYAISATNLWGVFLADQECYKWLWGKEPNAVIAGSILIYGVP